MKKLVYTMLALLLSATASAQSLVWSLVTDNGSTVPLSEVKCLVAADAAKEFTVVLTKGDPITGVKQITFASVVDGIANVNSTALKQNVTLVESVLNISNIQDGASISVFSLSGQKVIALKASGTKATVDVSSLTPGAYILKVDKSAMKFIKR
jgi:hypothetical protein